jgi:hypothetical protein
MELTLYQLIWVKTLEHLIEISPSIQNGVIESGRADRHKHGEDKIRFFKT